jgi:hypothetical protein
MSSFELVVVNDWVEFWRWQSNAFEKNGKEELGGKKITSYVVCSDSESYKSVIRVWLVKTENPSVCVTVHCKLCRLAVALYCL